MQPVSIIFVEKCLRIQKEEDIHKYCTTLRNDEMFEIFVIVFET